MSIMLKKAWLTTVKTMKLIMPMCPDSVENNMHTHLSSHLMEKQNKTF